MWVNEMWLLFTAVIFTAYGWWLGLKVSASRITETVIDSLISEGYLKTKGSGDDMIIVKYKDWKHD